MKRTIIYNLVPNYYLQFCGQFKLLYDYDLITNN